MSPRRAGLIRTRPVPRWLATPEQDAIDSISVVFEPEEPAAHWRCTLALSRHRRKEPAEKNLAPASFHVLEDSARLGGQDQAGLQPLALSTKGRAGGKLPIGNSTVRSPSNKRVAASR